MGQSLPRLSLDACIARENEQPEMHAFVRGDVFARVGARRVHGESIGNIDIAFRKAPAGSRCKVYFGTTKLQTAAGDVLYPVVFVTCKAPDLRTDQIFRAPSVIVEGLSPSTQACDRGLKFTRYRSLPRPREYALVDLDTREVQLFRRGADGLFTLHDLTGVLLLRFARIGCTVTADDLFEGIEHVDDTPAL